jgi:hypothetical protein
MGNGRENIAKVEMDREEPGKWGLGGIQDRERRRGDEAMDRN